MPGPITFSFPIDSNGKTVPVARSLSSEKVAYTGTAGTATGDYAGKLIRIHSTTDCFYRIDGVTATADEPSIHLLADTFREEVPSGSVSAVQESAGGNFWIDLLG